MKSLMLAFILSLSSSLALAAPTFKCRKQAQDLLSSQLQREVLVRLLLEVSQGSQQVDHLAIFELKGTTGLVYKALLTKDFNTCEFNLISIQKIY